MPGVSIEFLDDSEESARLRIRAPNSAHVSLLPSQECVFGPADGFEDSDSGITSRVVEFRFQSPPGSKKGTLEITHSHGATRYRGRAVSTTALSPSNRAD